MQREHNSRYRHYNGLTMVVPDNGRDRAIAKRRHEPQSIPHQVETEGLRLLSPLPESALAR